MTFLLWLICLAAIGTAYLISPDGILLGVVAVFILAPLCSWVLLVIARKKVRVVLTAPGVAAKGKAFTVSAALISDSGLPVGRGSVRLEMKNSVTGEVVRKKLQLSEGRSWQVVSNYCGCLEYRVTRVWGRDLFGVFPLSLPCRASKRTVIMPDTFPVEVDEILSLSDRMDSSDYSPDQKGQDRTEIYQIRDYLPGDSVRQIHWKLSSKLDKMIVRDPALPVDRELMVFLDRSGEALSPAHADALMEAVVSVCQALSEAGQPFRLAWNEELLVEHTVLRKEQLPEAVSAVLKSRRLPDAPSGAELYQKTQGGSDAKTVLYFCAQPPQDAFLGAQTLVFLCGEGGGDNVTAFQPHNVQEMLRKLSWS